MVDILKMLKMYLRTILGLIIEELMLLQEVNGIMKNMDILKKEKDLIRLRLIYEMQLQLAS